MQVREHEGRTEVVSARAEAASVPQDGATTRYIITGLTFDQVQQQIEDLQDCDRTLHASFDIPRRVGGEVVATGTVTRSAA